VAHYYYLRPEVVVDEGSPPDEIPEDVPEGSKPIVLQIYTDDNGLILSIGPPLYRAGDAAIKQMMLEWDEYVATAVGSPEEELVIQDIELFRAFLLERYPTTYRMTQRY
jgi:hypothetical protein